MKKFNNFVQLQERRELDSRYAPILQERFMASPDFIRRLGMYGELESHTGCVNCLEWSADGRVLASGSDDVHVVLWDPFKKKQLASLPTGHSGNIFTVKFLPNTENRTIVSGAADESVRVHDVLSKEIIGICTCHTGRVKRCVTDPVSPSLFWTAGEDGAVIQHDLRTSHVCPANDAAGDRNVLINLRKLLGAKAEAKCLAINPVRSDHIAVGANDPFIRIYDRRMIKAIEKEGCPEWELGDGAVQYFVPGHLPFKVSEYKRTFRSLASTYVTFSPDGKELLVNLGGEQIYLFPLVEDLKTQVTSYTIPEFILSAEPKEPHTNGYSNGYKNGTTMSSSHSAVSDHQIFRGLKPIRKPKEKVPLSPLGAAIKEKANEAFVAKKYITAVNLYNEALSVCPSSAVLYANRAAALLRRSWDGDAYTALKDCQTAIFLDPDYHKALLRVSRSLLQLKRLKEAARCLAIFKARFPDHAGSAEGLDEDLSRALANEEKARQDAKERASKSSSVNNNNSPSSSSGPSSSTGQITATAAAFLRRTGDCVLRFRRSSDTVEDDESDAHESRDDDEDSSMENESDDFVSVVDLNPRSSDSNASPSTSEPTSTNATGYKKPDLYEFELACREKAIDFSQRYCGHCNTTTDIKEANFFGGYIVAGSDDGSFYIWDRATTNIVKIIKGDESIVNCLQPHPTTCMLATSGIESVVRLWAPMPEKEGYVNEREVADVINAANANQKRMNTSPFEVILRNMGYRVSGQEDDASDDDEPVEVPMPCNPS